MSSCRVVGRAAGRVVGAAALLGALVTGCGIPPTGVIEAGEPATGAQPPGQPKEAVVRLFFLSAAGHITTSPPSAINAPPSQTQRTKGLNVTRISAASAPRTPASTT